MLDGSLGYFNPSGVCALALGLRHMATDCNQVLQEAYPSAAESRVLQRPSGASMLAAASMPIVAGSSVLSAAVSTPRAHAPRCSMLAIIEVPDRDDEQAVSMLMAGPAWGTHSHTFCVRSSIHSHFLGRQLRPIGRRHDSASAQATHPARSVMYACVGWSAAAVLWHVST